MLYRSGLLTAFTSLCLLMTPVFAAEEPSPGKQVALEFVSQSAPAEKMNYLLFLPKTYGDDDRKWPVMMFLHGSGERGDNIEAVKVHGPPKLVASRPDFPFIVISPQCPKDRSWNGEIRLRLLAELLDGVLTKYRTDLSRVSLTGLSMGGFGTWSMAARWPDRFAAGVPICGGGNPEQAASLKTVPLWVFHGAKDGAVPLKLSEDMVSAVQKVDGNVKLTIYPEAGHDSWTESYNNEALYQWLLEQRREKPLPLPTVKTDLAFVSVGSLSVILGDPADKQNVSASVYLTAPLDQAAALRRLVAARKDDLLAAFKKQWETKTADELMGVAGQQKSQSALQTATTETLFAAGSNEKAFELQVVFDQYSVRKNGRLKVDAK